MKCPNCKLENPSSAEYCDCGYAFPQAMRRCPYCAESIQAAAVFCKHCRRDLIRPEEKQSGILHHEERTVVPTPEPKKRGLGFWIGLVFCLFVTAALIASLLDRTPSPRTSYPIAARQVTVLLRNPKSNAMKGRMDVSNLVPIFRSKEDAAFWITESARGGDPTPGLFTDGKMTLTESGTSALMIHLNEGKSPLQNISEVELIKPYRSDSIEWKRVWTFNALIEPVR